MEHRRRYLIAHAATTGAIELRRERESIHDVIGRELRLEVLERERVAQSIETQAKFAALVPVSVENADKRYELMEQMTRSWQQMVMPWLAGRQTENGPADVTGDLLDWYLTFRPDLLREALNGDV